MTAFKVGDRVHVDWSNWTGDGVVVSSVPQDGRGFYRIRMETGNRAGAEGGFDAGCLRLLQSAPPVVRVGDRVKVTIEGTVKGVGRYVIVHPDGCNSRGDGANHVDLTLEGVTLEVQEPEYKQGIVVKDALGQHYKRDFNGWLSFGTGIFHQHAVPARPLTILDGGAR